MSVGHAVKRDVKGLYKKALAGELKGFTGVSDPYEPPLNHKLTITTSRETPQESLDRLLGGLEARGYISAPGSETMSTEAGDPISAHGGAGLVDLDAPAAERGAKARHAEGLKTVRTSARDLADLEMLASGAFSPLTGFMGEADYVRSRDAMRLASGVPWSIPITLECRRPRRARSTRARRSRWLAATADAWRR